MLEIKPFDAWAEANATPDQSEKIKQYADYVRTSLYKNGSFNENSEQEIQQGIYDRAVVDGLISDEEPDEDKKAKMLPLLAPTRNRDADAKFLLDHYQTDFAAGSPEYSEKAPAIQRYLSLKQTSPDSVGDLQSVIDGYLDDKSEVKNARLSAVDRGDYRVIAVDEADGRQLYTGADAHPDNLNGELDSLISNGAISPSDLTGVNQLMTPINGGKSTVAEATRYSVFQNAITDLAKNDPTIRSSLDQESARMREATRESQMTTGESIFDGVKKAIAIPFDFAADVVTSAFGLSHPEEKVAAPSELISSNKAITSRFSNTEVDKFLGAFLKRQSGPVYRADRPETGIDVDSLGNPIVSPSLVANKAEFEKALSMAPLNADQKERATVGRLASLELDAPKILKLILGESDQAVSSFAQAKAAGKTDAQFVEDWVGNNSENYNGFSERLQQFGMSTFSAVATLPVGIGALMGIEPAAKALVAMSKEQSDREEYARLFGDEFGLGFQLINTIPQVATDILATIGTEGAYTAIKNVARGGVKAVTREALRGAVSMVDEAAAVAVKNAAKAGGEGLVGDALKSVGDSLASKLARADDLVPLFATSFTRSASSTYGSIYGQLPDTMSHEEKHKNAFGYAIAAGLSTGIITSGMSFLGHGGVEDLATGRFRPATIADDTATNVRKVPLSELNYKQAKFLYENLENAGAKLADGEFKTILRANIGGAYKNYFKTVLKGGLSEGFEEGLDQAIQGRIEDAALDKNSPLAERVNQIFTAFALGGILGSAHPAIKQLVKPLNQSEISLALDARASVLTKVTNDLRKTGSTATAEVLQRQLNDAQAAANERKQLEIAAQQRKQERGKFEEVVTNVDKPISFEPTGQAELPLGDVRSKVLPETTRLLSDFEGERAYVGSYAGTLERVGDAVHLNLDEPRTDGVTHLVVGTKFQPLAKSGVRLDRKRLMVTGQHNGSIPAGTPYVAPNPRNKQQFALPPEAENVSLIDNTADSPVLQIKNARLLGQENITSDIILTDKGQIEDALRYYNLEFAELSKPENIQQLDFGLFDDAPAIEPATTPEANPTAIITPPTPIVVKGKGKKASVIPVTVDEGKPLEAATTPADALIADAEQTGPVPPTKPRTEQESYANDLITGSPLALALIELKRQPFSAEAINKVAQSFKGPDFADLQARIDKANTYALGLDDSLNETRQKILGQLEGLRVTNEQVLAATLIPATDPVVVEVPTEAPTEAALPVVEPAPKNKKPVAAKKVPVTPLSETTVVSNAEDPAAEADDLRIELAQLEETLTPLEDLIKQIESNIATAEKESKAPIPSVVREKLKEQKDKAKTARTLVAEKATAIKEKIKDLTAPDPDVDTRTDEEIQAAELLSIMLGQQAPSPEAAAAAAKAGKPQKPFVEKKGVGPVGFKEKQVKRIKLFEKGPNPNAPTPIAVYRDGIFRNPVEAELFTNWVAGGFLISNLQNHGFDPKTVAGIPFQQHSTEIKKRLFAAVTERFPLVPIPEGTPDVASNGQIPNMEAAGRQRSRLPVIHDSDGKVIGGFFTNNPLVVAQQIDKGNLPVFVPKSFVGEVNPSIILAGKPLKDGRRQITGVKRFLGDTGVFNAGDMSLVGKSEYTPRNVMKSLGNILRDPASGYLNGAGQSPRNRSVNTFETYMNDMMAVSSDVRLEGSKRSAILGSYENLMSRTFGLDEDVARTAMSNAQIAYANSLKEFALARQIEQRLAQAQSEKPSATLLDLNIPKIILGEAISKDKVTPPIKDVAKIITSMYGLKGTPESILSNYGAYLYNSITSGDMRVGVVPFRSQVIKFARPTQKAERIRNTRARKMTGTQEEIDRTLNSIAADDISASDVTVYDTSIAGQLANTLDANPNVKDLLYRIVNRQIPIQRNIDSSDLISFAGRALGNYQLDERTTIANYLKNSEDGLDLANALIDLDWLPPVGFKTPTPRDLELRAARVEPLPENATLEEKKARIGEVARMAKDLYQSEGQGRLLADTARKVNSAEIKRLGIVSNDPASVFAALQNIQESGTPMQRLVAGVLTANPNLIHNVNFVIGDMNDVRFAGAFMPKSNLVIVNLSGHNGRGIVDVLLHEYLHAVTIQTMTNPKTTAQIAALQRITALRNLTAAQAAKMGFDTTGFTTALEDDMEFITNALTAPEFQSLIRAATPTAQRSLLSRIWESLRSLFGYASTNTKVADAFDELLDFTQMFAGANTFNIRADRDIRLNERNIKEGLSTLRELAENRAYLQKYSGANKDVLLAEATPDTSVSMEQTVKNQLPEGMSVNIDSNLKGEAGVRRSQPNIIHINPELLANRVAGLSENAAKASIKGLVNHEVAHAAVLDAFTPEHITRVANELGDDQLQKIAEQYYSSAGQAHEDMLASIKADRESGILSNERLADEWIRMQVEKAVYGRTYEDVVKAAKGNSTLLSTIVDAIGAFITRLRQRFTSYPSTETAASISLAARTLRKINKSKSVDFNADLYAEGRFGDTENFFAALDGSPVDDQVSYSIPVASSNEGKVDAMNERLRLYNLPSALRDIVSLRSGTINQITTASKSLIKYFPKLRDNALKGGVDIEDIKILFGTTAPPLTDADLTEIAARTEAYTATLPDTETDGRKADLAAEYSEKLKRERRLRFNEAFVKRQAAAEQSIRDAGFKELVDRSVLFRQDISNLKRGSEATAKFDESNDVYLTRAYKFFNTAGWSLAAKSGGIMQIEGQPVDFDKLRANAAAAYYEEAEAELQSLGKPYTTKDVDDLTLNKLDRYLSSLETMTSAIDQVSVDSIRKDLNRFKPKKDIDSTFRELLGEIEDPLANAINTAFRVGMLSANDRFSTNFAKTAVDLGLASKDAKVGWVTPFAASSEKTTGALAGLYFDPKVAGVLNEMFGTNMKGLASNSTNLMNNIGRAVMGVSGAAIQMKTQLGFGYWPRNTIGGFVVSAAQGILMNPFSSKGRQSIEQAWRGSFAALGTGEEQRNSILRLIQLNVINDQSQGRAAQDLLKGIIATPEQDLQALMAAVDEARITKDAGGVVARLKANGYIKGGLAKAFSGYSNVTDFLAALDGAIDASFKVNAYYYELGKIQEHFKNTLTMEAQEEEAARKVKLTFAGHSQVIDAVKSFNKTPMAAVFLPFARWKSEIFRTMINTVPLALEEIKQGGVMARRGMQRLAGFSATLTAAPVVLGAAMTTIFRALTGDDEKEERELTAVEMAALRESLPKWQRSHQLKAQVLKGGKIQMIDMSYILPHSQLTGAVNIITDGFKTGEGINGSRLASYIANDLIGTQIAATSLDEVLNNADDRGQPIYLDTDNGLTVMTRVLSHFGKGAVMPSGLSKALDVARSGQTNREELVWGEILGSRPKTITFGDVERRGFRNLKGLLDNSVSIIGDLTSGRYKSDSEIDDIVDRHQDAMNESQRRMNRFMHSMVSMGSDPSSVYSSAKLYKFSDDTINSAYQGYRIAWRPNDKWNEKTYFNAAQSKEQDPMQKIQSVNRSVNRKGSIYYVSGPYDD